MRWPILGVCGLLALAAARPAAAQYFGKNKIVYDEFHFHVASTEHFDLLYCPEAEAMMRDAGRMLERWQARFSNLLRTPLRKNTVILYANDADFQQTNVIPDFIGQGVGGATESLRQRMVLPMNGAYGDIDHVLGHELVHVFQFTIQHKLAWAGRMTGALPLWLVEGMPEYLTLGGRHTQTAMWLRDALLRNQLPTLADMTYGSNYFPYRWGHALWAYIAGRWGDETVERLFRAAAVMGWERGVERTLKLTPKQLSQEWHASIREGCGPLLAGRQPPEQLGHRLGLDSELNLAPSLSPDGTKLAWFTQRDIFTVELYLYDLVRHRVSRKLSTSLRAGHFDALRFVDSAGAWSPDSQHFCLVTYCRGANSLAIVNPGNGSLEDELHFPGIGSIANPAWSPDGEQLAFTGNRGGVTDLYIYRRSNRHLRQVTRDRHADFQPAWSPDGRTIALATDRGPDTNWDTLACGRFQIGLLDVATGAVTMLPLFEAADHFNPCFSGDGRNLFFIADRHGFPDIYRYDLVEQSLHQVTRSATGVSGLTPRAPAMSIASQNGQLAFSVFQKGGYQIHLLPPSEAVGQPLASEERTAAARDAAVLPGQPTAARGAVAAYLSQPRSQLPEAGPQASRRYRPQLQLDYLGGSFSTVVASQFAGLGGGAAAQFSDLLGNHTVGLALSVPGNLRDVAAQALYWNMERRIHWGASALYGPAYTYHSTFEQVEVEEGSAIRERTIVDRVALSHGEVMASYPFSMIDRLEVGVGYSAYSFERYQRETVFQTGRVLSDTIATPPAPGRLSVGTFPIAWVSDDSYFGLASPVRGHRYRLQVEPSLGSLRYHDLLADYRHYFFDRRFTVAVRAMHFGHYGPDAENDQVPNLFAGSGQLVRGYDYTTFNLAHDSDGAALENLIGSRLAIASLEIRVPVLGVEQYGLVAFPYLPLEVVAFADSGVAWRRGTIPDLGFGDIADRRVPVMSAGAAARINLAGVMVMEFYYAYPFQHPRPRGQFGFQVLPGW